MPRPLVVFGLLMAGSASAQDPMRPWDQWRKLETAHYRMFFPAEYERWSVDAARRIESIDSAITRFVGWRPSRKVNVVVHDPFTASNGYVIPLLDATTTVWWATPPDPRNDIGTYSTWSEMLGSHELSHVAHLTRPTRNGWQRFIWSLMPDKIGPIAKNSPRWVIEGYPTVLEGRITGSGRPNGAWRPAILRQWAIEGRLPTYGAMNGSRSFGGGAFAYLSGSAYLEWLMKRQGDSSLVDVWRRMTAVTRRSFDRAFIGVYGDSPAALYQLHVAELTADAMRVKADLERAGLQEGELIQRLNWGTGDPAISPDGGRVAVTLGEMNKPSRLVVWSTSLDTATPRRRFGERAPRPTTNRDPEDVPDKSFYPPARRIERSLPAEQGNPYLHPRWFADNRRVMVTRWTARSNGTGGPDAYIWNTANNSVTRVTTGQGIVQADPSPDSREAAAMRCHEGHCDIVRIYFAIGNIVPLLEGSPTRSYYRPRFSPDGQKIVASVADSGVWRLIVIDRDGKNPRRIADDGVNRYDAQWVGNDSLVVVSERGGIPNLELVALSGGIKSLTRVTGAAVAPEVNPDDHSIWFLSMHSRGFDVRRLNADATPADSAVSVDATRYAFAGIQHTPGVKLTMQPSRPTADYDLGYYKWRWLPSATGSVDGFGAGLTLFRGDIVGRWNTTISAVYGGPGSWRGASVRTAFRFIRPTIEFGVHRFEHLPSKGRESVFDSDSLDADGLLGVASLSHTFRFEGARLGTRIGFSSGSVTPRLTLPRTRSIAFLDFDLQLRQMGGSRGALERLQFQTVYGNMRVPFRRHIAKFQLATLGDGFPLDLSWTLGKMSGSRHTFEEFSIGGMPSATMDTSLMRQRLTMPLLPSATDYGRGLQHWRVAFPSALTLYVEGAAVGNNLDRQFKWHRAIGLESRVSMPPIPVAFAPAIETRLGIGFSLDQPLDDKFRLYFTTRFEP